MRFFDKRVSDPIGYTGLGEAAFDHRKLLTNNCDCELGSLNLWRHCGY